MSLRNGYLLTVQMNVIADAKNADTTGRCKSLRAGIHALLKRETINLRGLGYWVKEESLPNLKMELDAQKQRADMYNEYCALERSSSRFFLDFLIVPVAGVIAKPYIMKTLLEYMNRLYSQLREGDEKAIANTISLGRTLSSPFPPKEAAMIDHAITTAEERLLADLKEHILKGGDPEEWGAKQKLDVFQSFDTLEDE